jgi:hypothetical protein
MGQMWSIYVTSCRLLVSGIYGLGMEYVGSTYGGDREEIRYNSGICQLYVSYNLARL